MPAPGPPLRVPHGGLGASAKMNHAPGKDGGGSLCSAELHAQGGGSGGPTKCCLHGRSVGCPGRGHVPFREDACVGVRLGESCSGRAFPPGSPHTALPTRLASCGRRQSCHRAVALGTSSPGGHRAVRLSVPGHCAVPVAGAHAHTHSAAFESHQGALKLGVIFINLPRFSFSEIWCCLAWMNMGKPALVDTRAFVHPYPHLQVRAGSQGRESGGLETFIALVGHQETSLKHTQSLRTDVGRGAAPYSNTRWMQHVLCCVKWSRMQREEWLRTVNFHR